MKRFCKGVHFWQFYGGNIFLFFIVCKLCYSSPRGGKTVAKYTSKINKIRTFALSLVFIGFIIMYIGLIFKSTPVLMFLFFVIGFLSIIASAVVYFMIGMLSTKAVQVVCPSCQKVTKILGRVDMCMYCREPLTLDKELEGKEFDESYNSKRKKINN